MQFIVRVIMRVLFGVAKARPSSRRMPRLGARRVLACLFRFFPSNGLICGSIANVEFRSAGAAGAQVPYKHKVGGSNPSPTTMALEGSSPNGRRPFFRFQALSVLLFSLCV